MNCTCQLYICVGFQCHTWEVEPSRQFGYEGQPCMLSLVSGLVQKHLVLETDLCLGTTRFVPFDEVGRKVTSPSNISSDFRVFTWIFCRFHFLLVLPSSRTFLQWHYSSSVFSQPTLFEVLLFHQQQTKSSFSTWACCGVFHSFV